MYQKCNYPHEPYPYGKNQNEGLVYLTIGIIIGLILIGIIT